jgi:hypothetical protein
MNKNEIKKLLEDFQELHSEFQIRNFIIGNEGDDWAKYKQCLREIKARYDLIKKEKMQIETIEAKPKLNLIFWPSKVNIAKRKFIKISLRKQKQSLCDTLKERERELNCFVEIAKGLKERIGDVTDERRQQLELESWTAKGRRMVKIDQILTGRVSHQTFEFVLSLPVQSQQSILEGVLPDKLMLEAKNL